MSEQRRGRNKCVLTGDAAARGALLAALALASAGGCRSGSNGAGGDNDQGSRPIVRDADPAADALVNDAEAALAQGQEAEALALLERAIEQNPELTTAHLKMGEIYKARGDYKTAEKSYADAARVEPGSFDAQYGHGLVLHLMDRLTDAVGAYLRALAIRPDDFDANLNIATAYLQLNEDRQALVFAQRAVQLDPRSGPAHANLGSVLSRLGRHAEAVREYEAASELMDLSSELLLNLADSLGKLERYAEMVNTLNAAVKLQPSAVAYERLGFAYFKQKDLARSAEHFRAALKADPEHYPALNGLGVCLLNDYVLSERKNARARDEGIETLRRSLQINRDQPKILELVGRFSG